MATKVLIVKPSSLGDIAQTLALVPRLRALFPGGEVHWLCNAEYVPLVRLGAVDRIWAFERQAWRRLRTVPRAARNFAQLCRGLRRERFDAVLDAQALVRSAWFARVTGAPVRVGFAGAEAGASATYTHCIAVDWKRIHALDRCLLLLGPLGDKGGRAAWQWHGLDEATRSVYARWPLLQPRGYMVFVPGTRGEKKRWPTASFAALCAQAWQRWRLPIVLLGTGGERALIEDVARQARAQGMDADGLLLLAGCTTIEELAVLARDARVLVGSDTGPMHLADALGAPVVALMGPTIPFAHGPYTQLEHVVTSETPCRPCQKVFGPCQQTVGCMKRITVEAVMTMLARIMDAVAAPPVK
jgi:lipopolysaccharide heptosyltransferase I